MALFDALFYRERFREHPPMPVLQGVKGGEKVEKLMVSITERDGDVIVNAPLWQYLKTPLLSLGEDRYTIHLPYVVEDISKVNVTKIKEPGSEYSFEDAYKVGDYGLLVVDGITLTFIPNNGKFFYEVIVPDASRKDEAFSAMLPLGCLMSLTGGS